MRAKLSLFSALALAASLGISAHAYSDEPDYSEYHPVTSMEAFSGSAHSTSESLLLSVEYYRKNGQTETALKLCRKAIDMDADDVEIHQELAECLEAKLKKQDERDPSLFNECVKEWLIVLRNTVGVEKGLNWHGLGFMGQRYEDELHGGVARTHLASLTGSAPRGWETDAKYIKRVTKPAKSSVSGKVVSTERNQQQ